MILFIRPRLPLFVELLPLLLGLPSVWNLNEKRRKLELSEIEVWRRRLLGLFLMGNMTNGKYLWSGKWILLGKSRVLPSFFYICRKMWGIPSFTLHTRSFGKKSRYMGNAMLFPSKIDFLLNCLNLSMFWSHISPAPKRFLSVILNFLNIASRDLLIMWPGIKMQCWEDWGSIRTTC